LGDLEVFEVVVDDEVDLGVGAPDEEEAAVGGVGVVGAPSGRVI